MFSAPCTATTTCEPSVAVTLPSRIALVNLSLLLAALRSWRVYRLSGVGSAVPLLPFVFGLLVLAAVMVRTGPGGYRLAAVVTPGSGHLSSRAGSGLR